MSETVKWHRIKPGLYEGPHGYLIERQHTSGHGRPGHRRIREYRAHTSWTVNRPGERRATDECSTLADAKRAGAKRIEIDRQKGMI